MVATHATLVTDPLELERVDALVLPPCQRKPRRLALVLNAIFGVMYVGLGLMRLLARGGRAPELGYLFVALGLIYLGMFAFSYRAAMEVRRRTAGRAADVDVTISDAGLSFAPSDQILPWTKVAEVRDVGDYLVFIGPTRVSYATIAKRALANDGRDLWAALDDRFVAKRYLVRGALSSVRIVVGPGAIA